MKPSKVLLGSFALGLLVLGGAIIFKSNSPAPRQPLSTATIQPPAPPPVKSDPVAPLPTVAAPQKHPALTDFRNWADDFLSGKKVDAPQGERFAMNRRNYMRHLIKTDPEQALAEAASEKWRRSLPSSVTQHFEQRVDDRGSLEVRVGTDFEQGTFQVSREVMLGERRYDAFVYGSRRAQMSQTSIPIHGVAIDKYLAIQQDALRLLEPEEVQAAGLNASEEICGVSTKPADVRAQPVVANDGKRNRMFCGIDHYRLMNEQWLAAEGGVGGGGLGRGKIAKDTWNQGAKTVLYMRLNFPDDLTEPITEAGAYANMNSVNDFYVEGSYNTCQMLPTVTPLMTLPHPKSYYTDAGAGALQSDARQLAREIGYETTKYDRDIVAFTGVPGYSWGGLASVGGKGVWLQGYGVGVTSHELGHNEGLWHANWWDTSANSSIIGVGTHIEYGNVYDTMGSAGAGANQFNAMHKWRMDWLPERYIHDITTNGVYRLYPFDVPQRTNTHFFAARVRKDWQRDYWIEMRQKFSSNPWLVYGVSVNWSPWDESSGGTHLLDSTPGTPTDKASREDAAVTIGRTFDDYVNGVYITPIARGGVGPASWIDVAVNSGAFPSNRPPTLAIAADLTNVLVGARINFSSYATDLDGDTLAYYWDFGDLTFFTNSAPLAFKTWNTDGDHVVRCVVSDMKGGSASANVLVTVGTLATTNRIMGRITDTNGVPVEGVRIDNEDTDPTTYRGGYSDSGGNFIIGDIPPGTSLTPVKYGYTFEPATFSTPGGIATNDIAATAMTTVSIAPGTNYLSEPGEFTDVVITRVGDTNSDLAVALYRSGTATMGSDYSLSSLASGTNFATITIPAGSNSVSLTLQVLDDNSGEGPETVTLTLAELTNANSYIVTTLGEATVTILDNDTPVQPSVSISATTSSGDNSSPESGEDNGRFVITRNGSVASDLTVFYSVSGSATVGVDYEALPGVVIIPAGRTTASVEFRTIDDPYVEPEETVNVTISANAAYNGAGSSSTVRIIDDDLVSVTIAPTDGSAGEPSATGRFTVTRAGNLVPSMVVNYTVSGTASNGVDYQTLSGSVTIQPGETTANITVTPIDDALAEGNETVILTVASSATYNVGSPGVATIVIQDDEQIGLTITATDDTASEPGSDTGLVTISRGSSTSGDLTVFLAVSGTALPGHDYIPLENSVVIPNGSSSVDVMITAFNDLHQEPPETVIVTMLPSTNYILGSSVDATVNINDDDGSNPPAVGFALALSSAPESRAGGIIVSLSITSSSPISVNYMVYGGTASPSNVDFTLPPGTLTFDPGQISKSLPLTVVNDNTVESDETIKIVLLNPVGAAHDGIKFHTYTILDDDKSTITVTATTPTATEAGVAQGNFRISRSGSTNSAQTVFFDVTGSASTPSDYAALGHSVTIPAGVTSVNLPVIPVDDNTIEVDERVVLTLTSAPGAKLGGADQATVTIIDNDPDNLPAINIIAGDAMANEGGGDTGNFVFSRVGPSNAALTVFYTISGTAANGSDYANIASSVSFSVGQTQLVVNVTPINDNTVEGEETVVLTLEMRDTYRIGNPADATVVILDNDQNVWLELSDSYAAEPGWDTGEFTFMRFGVTNTPVTVLYTRTGTASNGVDFISITNSIVIPANASQARLTIVPKDDFLIEPTETVVVTVQNNAAYFLIAPTAGTVFIHDNEPMVWLTSVVTNASESGESPGLLLLERGGDPTINLEVFLSFTGTATFGVDYPAFKTNICLPPGVMSALITISPTNELVLEPQETVFAQILPSPSAYTILSPSNATVTIDDMGTNRFPVAFITSPTVPLIFAVTSNLNVILEATGTDEVVASTNLTFAWDVISGDTNNVIFGDPATNNTTVSFTNSGVYTLRLAVNDGTLRGFDYLTVVVDATNLFTPDLLHWTFDEGSGTNAVDASGHGRDGLVTDATWLTNGIRGGALSFNGATNSVMEISGTNFLDGLEALTVAMWVKTSATNAERGLFAGGLAVGTNSALAMWQGDFSSCRGVSNLLQVVLPTTAGDVRFTSSKKFASNQWQHVALVWTNGQPLALYINGERDVTGSPSAALNGVLTNCSQFVIGRGAGTNYWNGQVDDVRLFARALDFGEVKTLVVMPPTNFVPIVDAGTNLTVQIVTPGNLAGQIQDDGQPVPPGFYTNVWQFVAGAGLATIAEPTNLNTAVSFTNFGNYIFRLIADDGTAKIFDDVMVTVTEPTTVSIFPADSEAAELGPDEGRFTITRTGDTNFDLTVTYAITGIASNGVDYVTITNALLLPASSNDVTIVIRPFLDNRTEGDEDVTLVILPQLAYTIGSPSATVTIHDSPYGVWTIGHFTLEELTDPSLSGEVADFDHDRVNNFLEYAFNREPKVVELGSPMAVAIETNLVDNLGHITATYSRRIQPIDVQYEMIISTNMLMWQSGSNYIETLSIVPDPNGFTETVKDQIKAPYTSTTIQFLTIRVWRTLQP